MLMRFKKFEAFFCVFFLGDFLGSFAQPILCVRAAFDLYINAVCQQEFHRWRPVCGRRIYEWRESVPVEEQCYTFTGKKWYIPLFD